MKKIFFSLIALLAVITVQAQSICGTWKNTEPDKLSLLDDSYKLTNCINTFNADGTFTSAADVTVSHKVEKGQTLDIALFMTFQGTYSLQGDKMLQEVNFNSMNIDVRSISENGKVINSPELYSKANTLFKEKSKTYLKTLKKGNKNSTYTVKLNDPKLELTDDKGKVEKYQRISNNKF